MQMKDFSLGVRCKLEIFPLVSGSLDLLHDFSLSVQTCLSFSCVQADAFFRWRKCSDKSWQREKKSPEIAKLTTQSIVFFEEE